MCVIENFITDCAPSFIILGAAVFDLLCCVCCRKMFSNNEVINSKILYNILIIRDLRQQRQFDLVTY